MQKVLNFFRLTFFLILAIFFSAMCILTLYRHSWSTPLPRITGQKPLILMGIGTAELLIILVIIAASTKFSAIPAKKFVPVVLTVYTAVQVLFILLFPVGAYEDALLVEGFAKEILSGNFSSLKVGHYLGYYPNNIGITLFFTFLYSFLPNSFITLRLFNAAFNTVSIWLTYKLYKELYPEKEKNLYAVLLLSSLFIPAIILTNFTYGDIFCNTFCLAAMLNAVRFVKWGNIKNGFYTAVFLMLGNFMRSIALLFLFAILFYWFMAYLSGRKMNWKKAIPAVLVTIILFSMPMRVFSIVGVETGMIDEPVGKHANPVWRWINIGFPSGSRLGYWDGGRNASIFISRYHCDPGKASMFFKNDIVERYNSIGKRNTVRQYIKKTFWLWTEGTYSVNFYGLSQAVKPEKFILFDTPLIRYVEPWNKAVRVSLDWLLHSYNWVTLLLAVTYLTNSIIKRDFRLDLFVYVILLYIGFYLLWEVKARYLFGLYPIYIIMSCEAASNLSLIKFKKLRLKN